MEEPLGTQRVKDQVFTCLGNEQITNASLAASVGLASIPARATHILLQAVGQNVRYRLSADDASAEAPTTALGQVLIAGSEGLLLSLTKEAMENLRFIKTADGATVEVTYFR